MKTVISNTPPSLGSLYATGWLRAVQDWTRKRHLPKRTRHQRRHFLLPTFVLARVVIADWSGSVRHTSLLAYFQGCFRLNPITHREGIEKRTAQPRAGISLSVRPDTHCNSPWPCLPFPSSLSFPFCFFLLSLQFFSRPIPRSSPLASFHPTSNKRFTPGFLEHDATTGAAHSTNNAVADRPRLTVPSLRNKHRLRPRDEPGQFALGSGRSVTSARMRLSINAHSPPDGSSLVQPGPVEASHRIAAASRLVSARKGWVSSCRCPVSPSHPPGNQAGQRLHVLNRNILATPPRTDKAEVNVATAG